LPGGRGATGRRRAEFVAQSLEILSNCAAIAQRHAGLACGSRHAARARVVGSEHLGIAAAEVL
jgi:hypothetical protein